MKYDVLEEAFQSVRQTWPEARPLAGIILGSGWGEVVDAFKRKDAIAYEQIPGLGAAAVQGHLGRLVWAEAEGHEFFIFQGRRHWYEGEGWTPVALPVYLVRRIEARILVLTNAAGGIRADLQPGNLMVIHDHINRMGVSPLIGPHNPVWGPRFPDQTRGYDPELQHQLFHAADAIGEKLKTGVYLAAAGPEYETPAEIRAYATMGADAVGMSTVPEAILGNAAGLRILALSCITNAAAGRTGAPLSHQEVVAVTHAVAPRMQALLRAWAKELCP